jgi:chemotaxis response regulator CheB
MDGVEATRRIMKATPCPIIVVTATVEGNASKVYEALGAGALDAVATPGIGPDGGVVNGEPLLKKIRAVWLISGGGAAAAPARVARPSVPAGAAAIGPMVAIGCSTGGPQALAVVLKAFPSPAPWPVVIVQHVDPSFAPGLADWLTGETGQRVHIARGGEPPAAGRILIAATGDHLVIDSAGRLEYTEEPQAHVYRPSVDVFFDSVLAARAAPGVAVVLTGMGRDGAAGLSRLREAGWHTIAQDKTTSVVWGMPGAAVEMGAALETLPIGSIGGAIVMRMMAMAAGRRNS